MIQKVIVVLLVFLELGTSGCASSPTSPGAETDQVNQAEMMKRPYVIVVSLDGYRNDYTDLYSPPHLKALRDQGASAEGLLPVFPSKTFTNHYSIATGLYAENHGIVGNVFYDPERKQTFNFKNDSTVQDGTWYYGTPLWVTAEQQGMLSATCLWPGSEAAIQGVRPSYYEYFNTMGTAPARQRIDEVIRWLHKPEEKRPHLIFLYFSEVDNAGHHFGPKSEQVRAAVAHVDDAIGYLMEKLQTEKKSINVIVLSDHGMIELDPKKVEYLDDEANLSTVLTEGEGPQVSLYEKDPGQPPKTLYRDLRSKQKHYQIFKREEVPARLHYSKSPRIGDWLAIAEAPYSIGIRSKHSKVPAGNHGYDVDETPEMQGIFYAIGPQIKPKTRLKPFRNIHIYPFILSLLGLRVETPIDGDAKVLAPILN